VRDVELGHASRWGEQDERLIHVAKTPAEAAEHLAAHFEARRTAPRASTSKRRVAAR